MKYKEIIEELPYCEPFLFVDELFEVNDEGAYGGYTFKKELDFYRGHFKNLPITPGVILTECCAQIGLVCLGIYLLKEKQQNSIMAFTSSEMEFYHPVLPGETVEVRSEKIYFRFGKLKCRVKMISAGNKLICKGVLSGMLKSQTNEN
ncbi:MAG: 3-hydroxyacyl-ACP dehydratase FabZ family protein [Flavobacteriaceae bacterium]